MNYLNYNKWKEKTTINEKTLTVSKDFKFSKYGFKFHNIIVNYLIKNSNWCEKKFNKNENYDYCNNFNKSKIKNMDPFTHKFWSNKFYFFHFLKNKKYIPETYIIKNGNWLTNNPTYNSNIYFMKDSCEDANRMNYLEHNIDNIIKISKKYSNRIWIIQPAIKNLLLYNKKKFDIRILVTLIKNNYDRFELIVFKKGIIRQTFHDFDENSLNCNIQMTNYCVQNKFLEGLEYFDDNFPNYNIIFNKILYSLKDIFKTTNKLLINSKKYNSKMICNFGVDCILNKNLDVFILEYNINPTAFKEFYFAYEYLANNIYTPIALDKKPNYDFNLIELIY